MSTHTIDEKIPLHRVFLVALGTETNSSGVIDDPISVNAVHLYKFLIPQENFVIGKDHGNWVAFMFNGW